MPNAVTPQQTFVDETFFISYSQANAEFVRKLAEDLRSEGVQLWLDQLDISTDGAWDKEIEKALVNCSSIIAVISKNALTSPRFIYQVGRALEQQKHILPILIEECQIPFKLRRLQYIDFTESYNFGYSELLSVISTDVFCDFSPRPVLPRSRDEDQSKIVPLFVRKEPQRSRLKLYLALCSVLILTATLCYLVWLQPLANQLDHSRVTRDNSTEDNNTAKDKNGATGLENAVALNSQESQDGTRKATTSSEVRTDAINEQVLWKQLSAKDTTEAYKEYLAQKPQGAYAAEARDRIAQINESNARQMQEMLFAALWKSLTEDTLTQTERLELAETNLSSFFDERKVRLERFLARERTIQKEYAHITNPEHFTLCKEVEGLEPVERTTSYKVSEPINIWARVASPRAETLRVEWFRLGQEIALRETDITVVRSPFYRIYNQQRFQEPGNYEVRLSNQAGRLLGRQTFTVTPIKLTSKTARINREEKAVDDEDVDNKDNGTAASLAGGPEEGTQPPSTRLPIRQREMKIAKPEGTQSE